MKNNLPQVFLKAVPGDEFYGTSAIEANSHRGLKMDVHWVDTLQYMEGHRSTPGHRQRDFKWLSRGFKNLSREAKSLDKILFYPAATKPLTRDIDRSFLYPWTCSKSLPISGVVSRGIYCDNIVRHSNNTGKMDVHV